MSRTPDKSVREPHRPPRLRVLGVTAAVARYGVRNGGRLFRLLWLPGLLLLICQVVLDWLALAYPPRLPAWLLAQQFNPPTWLAAVVVAPWGALAWAFVLREMTDRNGNRDTTIPRRGRTRRALIGDVLLATVIFSAVNLLDGGLRALQINALAALHTRFALSDNALNIAGWSSEVVHVIAMAAVVAASYLSIGQLLRTGRLNPIQAWRLTRGNRPRLFALFLLLSVAAFALNAAASPAVSWVIRTFADELFWTLKGAFTRQLVDIPFFMLWTIVYALTVGIVLEALEQAWAASGTRAGPPGRDPIKPGRLDARDGQTRR